MSGQAGGQQAGAGASGNNGAGANGGSGGAGGGQGASGAGAGQGAGNNGNAGAGANGGSNGNAGAGAAAGGSSSAQDWTAGLADDVKGFVTNKGWKGAADVLESYRNLEKLQGVPEDQIVRLPKADDAEGWGKVFNKLGRPEKPEEYGLSAAKDADPEFSKWASNSFHDAGLTKTQAEKVVAKWNDFVNGAKTKTQEVQAAEAAKSVQTLKTEWGAAYEQNCRIVDQTANTLGMKEAQVQGLKAAMGAVEAMKFIHGLGVKVGEDKFISGGKGGGNGILTPQSASEKKALLMQDKDFMKRYMSGDMKAKEEMTKLHQYMNPDTAE